MKNYFFAFVIVIGLSSCSKDLDIALKGNSKWILTEWPNKTIPNNSQATLNIIDGTKISGKSFCNTYGGNATFNGNAIQFNQLFVTKMYCSEVADAEAKFLDELQAVSSGNVNGTKLTLMKDRKIVMIFSKAN